MNGTELPMMSKGWAVGEFTVTLIHALFHRLYVSGIMKLLMDGSIQRSNDVFVKQIQAAIHNILLTGQRVDVE